MGKISREELMKKVSLSLDDLEKATGGTPEGYESWGACYNQFFNELMACIGDTTQPEGYFDECMAVFNHAMDTVCVR